MGAFAIIFKENSITVVRCVEELRTILANDQQYCTVFVKSVRNFDSVKNLYEILNSLSTELSDSFISMEEPSINFLDGNLNQDIWNSLFRYYNLEKVLIRDGADSKLVSRALLKNISNELKDMH